MWKYFPPPKSWTKITFYGSPWLFIYSGRRCEVAGFHTLFYLDDVPLCHLNRCYSEPESGLFIPSSHHLSKTKQANKPSKRAIFEGNIKKMTTRSLWAVLPLNSKHYLCRFPCLNCWHESCNFIPKAGCSSGLEAMQLAYSLPSLLHFFRVFCISEAHYTMIKEGRQEVGFLLWHWLLTFFWPILVYFTKEATEFPSSEFLSKCVVITMEIHSREKDFPAPSARKSDWDWTPGEEHGLSCPGPCLISNTRAAELLLFRWPS